MKQKAVADHRSEIVLAAGSATTLATLAGVYALAHHGTNIMGWYANFVIPAGALLVGMACASGYAIAGWFTGLKMTKRLVWSIVGQLVLSYFIAQYEEYRLMVPDGSVGFWSWFDIVTRAFSFQGSHGEPGDAFGMWGYAMRALEIAGFIAGGVIVPAMLHDKPYCEPCRTYMRSKPVAVLAGGAPGDPGEGSMMEMFGLVVARDRAGVERFVAEHGDKRVNERHEWRLWIHLIRCPRCAAGYLNATRREGHGKQLRIVPFARQALERDTVRAVFA